VNLSSQQFASNDLIETVTDALNEFSVEPQHLELEITESILMQNTETTITMLHELKNMGIRLAMDDFGTGYSSFSYLKRFPLDVIKIDRSFINDIPDDSDDSAIVGAIIAMAHRLNLNVIAEGVETEQQMAFLRDQGCDEVQGYLISRPLTLEDTTSFISSRNRAAGVDLSFFPDATETPGAAL
jgi:EAL domain-containing protein (putative c-di-GMP-specific phosphodiesterase class I)